MRRPALVLFALASLVVFGLQTVAAAQADDLAALWQETTDAFNAGEFTVEAYAAEGAIGEGIPCSALGTQTCAFAEGFAALVAAGTFDGATFTNLSVTAAGDVVSGQRELRSDLTRRLGFERVVQNYEVEYREGLIVRLTVTPDLSDAETAAFLAALDASRAEAAPDGLPNTGGGALADETSSNIGVAMGLASALAAVVVLAGGGARLASKRRRSSLTEPDETARTRP